MQDGTLDFQEFSDAMLDQAQDEETDRQLEEVRRWGWLVGRRGQRWLRVAGPASRSPPPSTHGPLPPHPPASQIRDVFALFDADGSGQLSADEVRSAGSFV